MISQRSQQRGENCRRICTGGYAIFFCTWSENTSIGDSRGCCFCSRCRWLWTGFATFLVVDSAMHQFVGSWVVLCIRGGCQFSYLSLLIPSSLPSPGRCRKTRRFASGHGRSQWFFLEQTAAGFVAAKSGGGYSTYHDRLHLDSQPMAHVIESNHAACLLIIAQQGHHGK